MTIFIAIFRFLLTLLVVFDKKMNILVHKKIMKRIFSFIFISLLFMSSGAYASVTIISKFDKVKPWKTVKLVKMTENSGLICLTFYKEDDIDSKKWIFSREDLEIDIDGNLYSAKVTSIDNELENFISSQLLSAMYCIMDKKIIENLKNAKTVVMKIHFKNQPPVNWEVPSKILQEWKEVISADFSVHETGFECDKFDMTLRETKDGVQVIKVNENSNAYGIVKEGDIILEINKNSIRYINDYKNAIEELKEPVVFFLISREGRSLYATIRE